MSITTEGLIKNPFHIIESLNNRGAEAFIKNDSSAKDGQMACVIGPNKEIMNTDYFPKNEFLGLHQASIRWDSDTSSGYGITVEYWSKDTEGNEKLVYSTSPQYYSDISDEFGNGAGDCFFHENYQYKLRVVSHPSLGINEYAGVDYLKLISMDMWGCRSNYVYGSGSDEVPQNLHIWTQDVQIVGDGTSNSYSQSFTFDRSPLTHYSITPHCYDLNFGYTAKWDGNRSNPTSFKIAAKADGGSNWSGTLTVICLIVGFSKVISLK